MFHKWSSYWEDKSDPVARDTTPEFYKQHGAELRVLYEVHQPKSVLDIGCGDGVMFEYLAFDSVKTYKGVDFSSGMLATFKERHPLLNLEQADGSAYCDNRKYDLIFSNGVVQYFDKEMLAQHFRNAYNMMTAESLFICASVPWKRRFFELCGDELWSPYRFNRLKSWREGARRIFISWIKGGGTGLGTWYHFSDFIKLADENGMNINFYNSMMYLYRFHAVMTLKS